jgi:predicted ATPase/class 3 adenylate cyclase
MTGDGSAETLAFVFTDLESSTRLWETFPEAMKGAMERHDAILNNAVEHADGRVLKATGDGLMAVFSSASDGALACLDAQVALREETWGETGPLRVRMGIHVGEAQRRAGDFFGPPVNRAARIMAAAHGGQVLLSKLAGELACAHLPAEASLRDLGEHRLKDLSRPERIFQLVHPALPGDFPPLATLSQRPNNLPTQASEFLGREAQLASLRDLLDSDGVRLLTLTGPGGIGKTRLALQAAAEQIDRFEDGVYFVDLSNVRDSGSAFEVIARTLDVGRSGDESPLGTLKAAVRDQHILLLLDNFEQVIEAADGVAELLQSCGQLKLLVTSREALRVRGEHLFTVPPLSLPHEGAGSSALDLTEYEAVRLFVERAREASPGFALSEDNAAAVTEICARLDGLALAIELAAARLRLFSPQEVRDRLQTRLELLRGGPRDQPARQRALRDTIEWSYELLGGEERAIFEVLSLFTPACVESVEEVVKRVDLLRAVDVVERLMSLVDKSLVRSVAAPGRPQLSMLETIREYAAERLEHEPELAGAARQAHAEYFSDFAEVRRGELSGPGRDLALAELAFELGNLRSAWHYWVEAQDFQQLNKLLDSLWVLHDAHGWYLGAVDLTNDLLSVLSSTPSTRDRAREEITLQTSLARGLAAIYGYTEEVEQAYGRALDLAEELGEVPRRFSVLRSLATFHLYRGEFEKTAWVGRQLLDLAEQEPDAGLQVEGHLLLGSSVAFLGDHIAGLDHLDRAIALFDPLEHQAGRFRLGPSPGVPPYTTSAFLLWRLGYPDRAAERAAAGLELAEKLHHPFTQAYALFHVGFLDLWRRDFTRVRERASGALDVAEEHDFLIWRALGLVLRGVADTGLGGHDRGLVDIDRGIALYEGLKSPPVFWPQILSIRAGALALAGRPAEGLRSTDEAIEMMGESELLTPELALLKGDLLVAMGDVEAATVQFQRVFHTTGELGLRMPQLQSATRLARLWRASPNAPQGGDMVREVLETFTEGFDTADLVEARDLLAELEAGRATV